MTRTCWKCGDTFDIEYEEDICPGCLLDDDYFEKRDEDEQSKTG